MFEKMNERVKRLTVMDIGFTKMAVLFVTIIIVKIFPQILDINYYVLAVLVIMFGGKPLYNFWFKK